MLLRALPVENCEVSGGLLCVKGRFELDRFLPAKEERLESPLVRRDGEFEETSFDEAILSFTRGAQSLLAVEGADKLAVSVSDEYTLEEIALIRSFTESLLEDTKLYSLDYKKSALEEVLGSDSSPNTFNEVFLTDLIIVVGGDLLNTHPMLATKIRRANKEGVHLGTINTHSTLMDKWTQDNIKGEQLADLLQNFSESDSALAQRYRDAKRAILVYDKDALSYEEELRLIELAQKSGHLAAPGNGVIQVKARANSQGLYDLGVRGSREELLKDIDSGQIKGLLVFGDSDLPEAYADKLSFLAVQASKYSPAFVHADVILPGSCLAEKEGLITSSEGRVQALQPVIAADAGSFDQLRYFWHHFDRSDDDIDLQTAREAVVFYNQAYQAILDPENIDIWVRPPEAKE
jgi:formate dehydrogenase major subunit